ncbi:MAG: hypothetical protein M0C28_19260 [Candidatus Moduliflexus flocculans]|nr:hypothetical protein [Candidatus Moduliflexus flocculans]
MGLFSGNNNEGELDSSFTLVQNSKALDFKAGTAEPGKDGVPNQKMIIAKAAALAVPFVKNVGQFDSQVKYAADLFAGRFFLTETELVYSLIKRSGKKNPQQEKHERKAEPEKNILGKGLAFKEFFVDKKGKRSTSRAKANSKPQQRFLISKAMTRANGAAELLPTRAFRLGKSIPDGSEAQSQQQKCGEDFLCVPAE